MLSLLLSFYFILQNNSKITILTFMNVDGAFILAETHRKTSVLLFVDNIRFINDSRYEFGKMFVARITLSHPCLVKLHKSVTEQLTSNTISAQIILAH